MNSKNIIIGILFLTTVGFGILWLNARQGASDLAAENTKLTKSLQSAQRASQRRPSSQTNSSTAQNPPAQRQQWQAAMQTPQAQQLRATQQRAMLDNRYAPLFKSLNLTPDQLAKFKDLLIEKQNAARDVFTVAREQGLTDRNEIAQLVQQAQADVDTSIAAVIGQDKLAQYQNYDHTAPQRAIVSQIAQSLSYTSEPLTPEQSEQLVALLAQNAPPDAGGGNFMVAIGGPGGGRGGMIQGQMVQGLSSVTDKVINQAQSFLSPAQVDALRQVQTAQQQIQQIRNTTGGGTAPTGGGGGGKRGNRGGRGGGGGGNGN